MYTYLIDYLFFLNAKFEFTFVWLKRNDYHIKYWWQTSACLRCWLVMIFNSVCTELNINSCIHESLYTMSDVTRLESILDISIFVK